MGTLSGPEGCNRLGAVYALGLRVRIHSLDPLLRSKWPLTPCSDYLDPQSLDN